MSENHKICVICSNSSTTQADKAAELSTKLTLPLQKQSDKSYSYHLVYTDNRLELQHNPHLHNYKHKPICVDFLNNKEITRRLSTSNIKDPLCRAVGIKPGFRPYVVDTTAGLGMDGLTLAWLGCKIVLLERSIIIHALLEDGFKRAKKDPRFKNAFKNIISLKGGNSIDILGSIAQPPDTILIDPMYPQDNKRALNKKEMRVLRDIVGDDNDSSELFRISIKSAGKRVVVKRPKGAANIVTIPAPSHKIAMKSGRFDVYLKNQI